MTDLFLKEKPNPIFFLSPQCQKLVELFEQGRRLTFLEAIKEAGTTSLHSRLSEIRRAGYDVRGEWEKLENGKRVKRYFLQLS